MHSVAVLLLCVLAGAAVHLYQVVRLLAWIERRSRWERGRIKRPTSAACASDPASFGLRPVDTGKLDSLIQQPAMPATASSRPAPDDGYLKLRPKLYRWKENESQVAYCKRSDEG